MIETSENIKDIYMVVTPLFPSNENWRGPFVLDQVKAIRRHSDYEIIVMKPSNSCREYTIDKVKVYEFVAYDLPSNLFNGVLNPINARLFIKRLYQLGIQLNRVRYVHCHVAMHVAYGLALKDRYPDIKVMLQHHDLDPYNLRTGTLLRYNRFNIRYRAKKALNLYKKVDLHICISENCKKYLISFPKCQEDEQFEDYKQILSKVSDLDPLPSPPFYILYNGVDCSLFNTIGKSSHDGVFRIGCVGNFIELKDQKTLIKAFAILYKKEYDNIRLSLVGTGPQKEACLKLIETEGIQSVVELPSELPHEKLPDYYKSLDLFVLPSCFEGFGCVYTEAYACGVPFMGVFNQGASECIEPSERNKWLIEPHDYRNLAKLIEAQINQRDNQHLCKEYDIDTLIPAFLDYIKTI